MNKIKTMLSAMCQPVLKVWHLLPHHAYASVRAIYLGLGSRTYIPRLQFMYKNYYATPVYHEADHVMSFLINSHTGIICDVVVAGAGVVELYDAYCKFIDDVATTSTGIKVKGYRPLYPVVSSIETAGVASAQIERDIRTAYAQTHVLPLLLDLAVVVVVFLELVTAAFIVAGLLTLFN